MLLDKHADINAQDDYEQTPLSVAADTQIKKILKDLGAKEGNGLIPLNN